MYDYETAIKHLFTKYYESLNDTIIITLVHNKSLDTYVYPISCLPLSIFDDYYQSRTVSYLPTDKELVKDSIFEIDNLMVELNSTELNKAYLITIDKIRKTSPALDTLFSLVKFKE